MQEQEQGLEKKERTVYLSSTGDFVNTDLANPREIKYAAEIQLHRENRDKFFGLKPISMTREEITKAAIEDTKRSYLKQAAAGVAAAGVQMGQEIYNFAMFTNPILVAKAKRLLFKRNLDVQKKYGVLNEEAYKRQLEELNAEYRGVRDTLNADLMAQREKQVAYIDKTGLAKKEGDSFLYDIANGVGSAAAALGLAIITKSPNAAVAMFGATAGQSGYEEALENGIAPEKALKLGGARGFVESLLERVGLHCAFESLAARGVLARIGKTALTEGVQEMSQQTAEEILQTKYGGRKEDFRTAVNNIIMSGFVGAFVGGGFGVAGARKGASVKQGLEDTGKQEIKTGGSVNITLEDAYFSGVKSLTDLGMPPEDAEKLTYSLLKKAAAPETLQVIREMLNEENSNLTYINNDEDQNAAAVKAAVEKATAPERVVREQAFNIADKVEEEALKAGREPEEAAASAALAQAASIGRYELTGVLPKDQIAINIESEEAASATENDLTGDEDTSFDVSTFNQGPRGSVSFADDLKNAFIRFNETADKSTLIHELSHIWLKDIERFAQISTKPEFLEFKENLDTWLGEPANGVYTVEQQEKFAKTFELYMQEGKAPNAELQGVFEKFKAWLREIYAAVKQYIELTPEAIKTFDTLLASEKGSYNIDKIRNKTAQAKAVVEKIKKGQAVNIDGVNIRDIKEALKVMRARIPAEPKENLLRTLRSKGADYDNAAKIDKEAYKNARVPNKKSGIQDNLALTLRDWGYMAFDDSAVADYNGLVEQNEIAADLIDKALNGEKVYKVGDQQAAKREQFLADVEAAREIVGEDSAEIARAITDLEKKGYRVIEKGDIDYLEKQLNQLDKIAEKAKLLEQNSEEQKKTEAFDKMQKQNALEARRIKTAVIEELEKRDLAGKDEIFKALEKAQTPDEIFTAAADILTQLEKEFANTEEGKAEQRKIDVPSTDWEAKRITLLKDLAEISKSASQAEARAREITNQAHLANQGLRASLTKEERAELEKAKTLLKKNFEKKYLKAFSDALSGEPHIETKDVAKIMKVLANNAMEMRLVSDSAVRQFIRIAQDKQTANYKKYLSGKISTLLNSKLYSKVGQLRRAKFTPEIMEFMTQAKKIWDMTNKEALQEYDTRVKNYDPEKAPSPVKAFENRLLEFKALWEKQNPADAKGLYDELFDLVRGDRTLKQFEEAKKQFNESGRRLLLTQALKERTLPTGTKTFLMNAGTDLQSALDVLFGKSFEYETMGFDGQMHKETFNAREEFAGEVEQIEEQNFLHKWNLALDESVREAYGLDNKFQMFDKIKELQDYKKEFINYGFVKEQQKGQPTVASIFRNGKWVDNNKPRTQTLNKLNIIYNYIQSQNHEFVETAEGSKDVGYAARLLRSYGKEQLAEMFDCLTAEDKKLADNLIKLASKFYPELNKVHKRIYGFALPKTEGVYFPGVTERIADDVDWHADFVANSKSPSFIKNRVKSDKPVMALVNPLAVLRAHGRRSAEFIYNAEKFTELKRLFKAEEMKTAFVDKFGQKDGIELYQKMLRLIDLQGPQKQKAKGEFFKVSDKIFNSWVKTAMGLKIMTGIKQVASGISFAEKMPSATFAKYFAQGMAHPLETMDYMDKSFPYIETRFETGGINEAVARAMARDEISSMGEKFNMITNLGLLNTRYGDRISISLFGYPYYKYLREDLKMPEDKAKAEFLRQATTTLQSSLKAQLSEAQSVADNFATRVFMVFRNQQLQYVRKAFTAYAQYKNGEISAKQFAKTEFIYLILNPLVYVALSIGLIPKDDEDKKRLAASPLVQTMGAYPFGEATAELFVDNVYSIFKDKKLTAPRQIGLPMFDDIVKDITRAIKTVNEDDITAEEYVDTVIGIAKYSGLPLNTLKTMIKGAVDTATGKPGKGALEMLGYTESRAGKIVGEEKKKKKRKRRARKKKK